MSNKFQPGEETFDEVSGHSLKSHLVDDDTEGHMPRVKIAVPQDEPAEGEDTEGHGFRGNVVEDEDTEGHMPRIRIAVPEESSGEGETEGHVSRGRGLLPEDEGTEGHGIRSGRALPEDEDGEDGDGTEGHGVRPRI